MNKLEESTKIAIKLSGHLEDVDQVVFITGFEEGAKWQAERIYSEEDINHLKFIYDRMVNIHNENENYDYMIKFKNIIKKL